MRYGVYQCEETKCTTYWAFSSDVFEEAEKKRVREDKRDGYRNGSHSRSGTAQCPDSKTEGKRRMKIICTEYEKEWVEDLLFNSYECGLECPYDPDHDEHSISNTPCSRRCREEHIEFEIEKQEGR